MFSTVVLPLDGAPEGHRAIPVGAEVAQRFGADVEVVHAVPELMAPHGPAEIESLAASMKDHGVQAPVRALADDDAAVVVARWTASRPDPLVVMATTSGGGALDVVLGSTAERLMHLLAAPVLLVGPNHQAEPGSTERPAVILVHGNEPDPETVALAKAWCDRMGATPWVVAAGNAAPPAEAEALVTGVARRWAEEFGPDAQWDVVHDDDPAPAIAAFADHLDAGVIITATRARAGLERMVAGSRAFAVAHQSKCPVLVHHPFTILDPSPATDAADADAD